jgi:hypothetical protein
MEAHELEERAARAYQAFVDSAHAFLPMYQPDWSQLPELVKTSWKAAVTAALRQV